MAGEELRATVLLQLLRTPSNALAAGQLPEVCDYLARPGLKRKEDTLWPLKALKSRGKCMKINENLRFSQVSVDFSMVFRGFSMVSSGKKEEKGRGRGCRGLSLQRRDARPLAPWRAACGTAERLGLLLSLSCAAGEGAVKAQPKRCFRAVFRCFLAAFSCFRGSCCLFRLERWKKTQGEGYAEPSDQEGPSEPLDDHPADSRVGGHAALQRRLQPAGDAADGLSGGGSAGRWAFWSSLLEVAARHRGAGSLVAP